MKCKKTLINTKSKVLIIGILAIIIINGLITFNFEKVSSSGSGDYPPPKNGNWVINNTTVVVDEEIILNGNLIINGNLTFRNVTLIMNLTSDGQYGIYVNNGGKFYILENSKITAYEQKFEFNFVSYSGSTFVMKNSELSECGYTWTGDDGQRGLAIRTNNAIIENNTFFNNYWALFLQGWPTSSNNHKIANNTFYNNYQGIYTYVSNNNIVIDNKIYNNTYGNYLSSSTNNYYRNNNFTNNNYNFGIYGWSDAHYNHNIDNISNTIDNKGIYLIRNQNNFIVNESINYGFLGIINCDNITVKNINITKNGQGVLLYKITNSLIENNNFSSNANGIYSYNSQYNIIKNNNVFSNSNGINLFVFSNDNNLINNSIYNNYIGIYIYYSSNNNLIATNSIYTNSIGIYIYYIVSNNNIIDNNIYSNTNIGIYLRDRANNNLITNNRIYSNTNYGIYIIINSDNNRIENNNIYSNRQGIYINSQKEIVKNNNIYLNTNYGINLLNSNNNISQNVISQNGNGIYSSLNRDNNITDNSFTNNNYGIYLLSLSYNNVQNNILNNNNYGIYLLNSTNNILKNNSITNGTNYGISLIISSENILENNTLKDNLKNFYINGNTISHFNQTINTSNTINNMSIYYLKNVSNLTFNETEIGFLGIISSNNITVKNMNLNNYNSHGILFVNSTNLLIESNEIETNEFGISLLNSNISIIKNNEVNSNSYGIYFESSSENTITNNNVYFNSQYGIYLKNANSNIINKNNIENNVRGIQFNSSSLNNINNNNISNSNYGIQFNSSSLNNITNNNISNSDYGIYFNSSSENNINKNIFTNNAIAIQIELSFLNIIDNNTLFFNTNYGIYLYSSMNNSIIKNDISQSENGVYLLYSSYNFIINNSIYSNINYGIYISSSLYNIITNNELYLNNYAIYLLSSKYNNIGNNYIYSNINYGIYISSSLYNNITNNTIYNSWSGIYLYSSANNNLINNSINTNNFTGIVLYSSQKNTMKNNIINNNKYNFGVFGNNISDYYQNIDTSNKINNKPIYYIQNQSNLVFDGIIVGYFGFVSCDNITVKNYELKNNGQGILFAYTTKSLIENNNVSNNWVGIYLFSSSNNNIIDTNINYSNNGIILYESSNNIIENSTIANSVSYDFYIESNSKNSAINTTFSTISISSNSFLIFKNYLKVLVKDAIGYGLENATVIIRDNNKEIFNGKTNSEGEVPEILITDRIYNGSSTPTENTTVVQISYRNLTFNNNPRDVNMSKSHTEIFNANEWIISDFQSYSNKIFYVIGKIIILNTGNLQLINCTLSGKEFINYGVFSSISTTIYLEGNLWINGINIFNNTILKLNSTYNGQYSITVNSTGIINILNNSKITANNTNYKFKFLVNSGSTFVMKNSELSYSGYQDGNDGRAGLTIKTNNYIIENNIIYNNYYGIYIYSSNNNITNNTIYNNYYGIVLYSSSYNNITNNTIYNNNIGIYIYSSSNNNVLKGNVIYLNTNHGIVISSSQRNNIVSNFYNNNNGIYLISSYSNNISNSNIYNNTNGIYLSSSTNNIINSNNIYNNFRGVYFDSSSSNIITNNKIYSNSQNGIYFLSPGNNIINYNIIYNNFRGIYFDGSSLNSINNNTIKNNNYGIYLYSSMSNNLNYNNISNNNYGLYVYHFSQKNKIYINNFINNTVQSYDDENNNWDNGKLGNYWTNYNGSDDNYDGIGDTPYNISENTKDNYPLMFFASNFHLIIFVSHLPKNPESFDIIKISANIFDINDDLYSVLLYYFFNGTWQNKTMEKNGNTFNITIGKFPNGSFIQYYIKAIDINNYIVDSLIYNFIIVDKIPSSVILSYSSLTSSSLILNWTKNDNSDFRNYIIYQSYNSLIWQEIANISSQNTISYTLTNLTQNTKYYFKIIVYDINELYNESNVINITTLNAIPNSSFLSYSSLTSSSIVLNWTKNNDDDFKNYTLFISENNLTWNFIANITDRNITYYEIKNLMENAVYYFKIIVYDFLEGKNETNILIVKTLNKIPSSVILSTSKITKNSITLNWSINTDDDFKHYILFISQDNISWNKLNIFSDRNKNSYIVSGLKEDTTYYFKILVYDIENSYNESNVIEVRTLGEQQKVQGEKPNAVSFSSYPISKNSIKLNWNRSEEENFANYTIFISIMREELGEILIIIDDRNTTSFIAENLSPNITYYFTLRVYNSLGLYNDTKNSTKILGETIETKQEEEKKEFPYLYIGIAIIIVIAILISIFFMKRRQSLQKEEDFIEEK